MGLFGGSTKVIVGSSAYNLAGEVSKRPNYLKTTVVGSVLSESPAFTPGFMESYLKGPGIKLKRFDNWAEKPGSYNEFIGNSSMVLLLGSGVNLAQLKAYMAGDYRQVNITRTFVGPADVSYWALEYLLNNLPQYVDSGWKVETKVRSFWVSDPDGNLTEQFEQYPPNTYSIIVPGLPDKIDIVVYQDPEGLYLYIEYMESPLPEEGAAEFENWNEGSLDPGYLPSVAGWALLEEYPSDHGGWLRYYSRKGADLPIMNGLVQHEQLYMYQAKDVTRVETEVPGPTPEDPPEIIVTYETYYNYRMGKAIVTEAKWTGRKLQIYRQGNGDPELDAMITNREKNRSGKFLPVIPVRRDNLMVDKEQYPLAFSWASKAFKKATGGNLTKLHKSLWDNPDLKQIDNAYVVFGIGLNIGDNESKEYLFEFFKDITSDGGFIGVPTVDQVLDQIAEQNRRMQEWIEWMNSGSSENRPVQPPFPTYTPMPEVGFRVTTSGSVLNWGYDSRISWAGSRVISGAGIRVPGTKAGDFTIQQNGQDTYELWVMPGGDSTMPEKTFMSVPRVQIVKQITNNSWQAVILWDLKHTNTIYKDRSVITTAWDALAKAQDTSFIVPVTMASLRATGLINSTQIAMSCSHLVVNYYDEVKIPWYASGFFQIIVIVVIIVVAVYTGGASGAAGGALGTNVAVGTALGFVGTAAIVAGAVANAFAGMIIATIIQKGSTALFGDKIGQIVGFIATAYTMNLLAGGPALSVTMESVMAKLRDPGTWIQMTDAVSGHLQAEVKDIAGKQQSFLEDYQAKLDEITGLKNQFGNTGVDLLSALTNATNIVLESPEQFLGRTLLTGDEIAAATIGMVENFPAAELRLPLT